MSKFEHINVGPDEVPLDAELAPLLHKSAEMHHHLCPRQVLGVRVGLLGMELLGFQPPVRRKRLLVIVETDGCFVSGVQAATGCSVNRRTLRINDLGRIGVTFVDVKTEKTVRVAPHVNVRDKVNALIENADSRRARYIAMMTHYQTMPHEDLLFTEEVQLARPVSEIVSRPFLRVDCSVCGEEIINERELIIDGEPVCLQCAGKGYYVQNSG